MSYYLTDRWWEEMDPYHSQEYSCVSECNEHDLSSNFALEFLILSCYHYTTRCTSMKLRQIIKRLKRKTYSLLHDTLRNDFNVLTIHNLFCLKSFV